MEEADKLFQVFSKEVWMNILEKCENVETMFKALPQLKIEFRGKAFSWQIDEIFLLLFPKLICHRDAMNCRLVSKRWKTTIDECLEYHVDLEPYNSTVHTTLVETRFYYRRMPEITNEYFESLRCQNKIRETMRVPASYNPFPGRSLEVTFNVTEPKNILCAADYDLYQSPGLVEKSSETLEGKMYSMLEKFGHHIWYITVRIDVANVWCEVNDLTNFIKYFIEILEFLPNLKSLRFAADRMTRRRVPEFISTYISTILKRTAIPASLNTLDLSTFGEAYLESNMFESCLKLFVNNHYSIKKLTIYVGNWNKTIANMLPNLTELRITECYSTPNNISLKDVLQELVSFPCLQKLGLMDDNINVTDLVQVNSTPQLHALTLKGKLFQKRFQQKHLKNSEISYVRNLKIKPMLGFGCFNLDFLKLFPVLQAFYVIAKNSIAWHEEHTQDAMSVLVHRILKGKDLYLEHFWSVWNTFPELKVVTVENDNVMYQLVREYPTKVFTTTRKLSNALPGASNDNLVPIPNINNN